jgi:hypothetical protein
MQKKEQQMISFFFIQKIILIEIDCIDDTKKNHQHTEDKFDLSMAILKKGTVFVG